MEKKEYYFAVDLGATSGRTIIGSIEDGRFTLEEVTRFPNNLIEQGGHFYWDIHALYFEIIRGLKEVASRGLTITSIGIDTWGVDFVMIGDDGAILRNPRAYRDPITFEAMDDYLKHVISKKEVYDITGIQFLNFNTIFQLYAMQKEGNSALKAAQKEANAKKKAVGSIASTAAGTIGRELGNSLGKGVGGAFGKRLGGNVGAALGRGLLKTFLK